MATTSNKNEAKSYFTEPGNGWKIQGTEHIGSDEHQQALQVARSAGFGSLVVDVVAVQCSECLKMLETLAPIA